MFVFCDNEQLNLEESSFCVDLYPTSTSYFLYFYLYLMILWTLLQGVELHITRKEVLQKKKGKGSIMRDYHFCDLRNVSVKMQLLRNSCFLGM